MPKDGKKTETNINQTGTVHCTYKRNIEARSCNHCWRRKRI